MTPREQLEAWRAELVEEKAALETELATARTELADAEQAYQSVAAEWADVTALANRGVGEFDFGMAAGLYTRLEMERLEALKGPSSARGLAAGRVKSLDESVAGRALALRQIDRALAEPVPLRPLPAAPKRVAASVEFDDIVMPREAQA